MHCRIRHHTHQSKSSGINYLEIPIYTSIPWTSIPLSRTEDQWKKVDNPEDIERCPIFRNRAHLSQAQATPFTISPLKNLSGNDSCTPFGNSLLLGTGYLNKLPLFSLQRLYLSEIKSQIQTVILPLHYIFDKASHKKVRTNNDSSTN